MPGEVRVGVAQGEDPRGMTVHMVFNNWIPIGSQFELTELLGVYGTKDRAEARMSELAHAVLAEYEPGAGVFHVPGRRGMEVNYYYIDTREVE